MTADSPISIMVSRRVLQDRRAAFEEALHTLTEASGRFPGHMGASVLKPGAGDNLYRILFRFDRKSRFDTWQADAGIQALIAEADKLTEGEPKVETLDGLEAWFTMPGQPSPPPRIKMAAVTWGTLFPLVSILLTVLEPVMKMIPFLGGTLLVTGLVTVLMTYVLMPRLTRLLAPWLFAKKG
jgi:antibiotic biosynthesis monooxygenase (ABM) superfamily enzyme